ncbi:uncharacterized protein PRCAT00006168001 [Priceomyces carsonii]|uniref:uncharacterized protein n=1 Tax=Priceomyces carsonii TaxID=28549 RepID=UPI002ED8B669|nr:unnamed protein product [Priceomyces carsonii]
MTVDAGIERSIDLDGISFGNSSLFGGETAYKSPDIDPYGSKIENKKQSESYYNKKGETESLLDEGSKAVTLLNGKKIILRKKVELDEQEVFDECESTAQIFSGKSNDLFTKANLRNAVKENRKKFPEARNKTQKGTTNLVWTEKYRPSKFVELCPAGNDKQYRLVLRWLKKWASITFHEDVNVEELGDIFGRPRNKILLIHGPVGIGKTAATNVIARQLGYSVQELNAADNMSLPSSRTSDNQINVSKGLKLKIVNALTTNSITSKGKPTCLIIDEIDTTPNSNEIIKILNELDQADKRTIERKYKRAADGFDSKDKKNSKNKKNKDFLLNRPIICIANDLYGSTGRSNPGMEKLRRMSDIIPFRKPTVVPTASGSKVGGTALRSIKEHLVNICNHEKLSLDYQQIGDIVEICEGDIRASLNYLQFNGRKITTETVSDNGQAPSSRKDSLVSWFSMVDMLFKRDAHLSKEENFDGLFEFFMNGGGLSIVSNSSAFEKVVKGSFNRYLDVVHYSDDSLKKPSELSDWLGFYDEMSNRLSSHDEYLSLVGLKIWSLFSEIKPVKNHEIESLIPNSKSIDFESYELLKQNKEISKRIIEKLPVNTRRTFGGTENNNTFPCYILPYIAKMLTPESPIDKAKATAHTFPNFERKVIAKMSHLINGLALTLESNRDLETGKSTLQFCPDIDSFSNFNSVPVGLKSSVIHVQMKRQWLFPLFKSELERIEMSKKTANMSALPVKRSVENNNAIEEQESKKRVKLSSSVEFFKGRYDDVAGKLTEGVRNEGTSSKIWVKYNEGFSNAVRKNIGWSDLWLP